MSTYAFVSQRHILIALLMPINGYVCLTTSAKANPLCLSAFFHPYLPMPIRACGGAGEVPIRRGVPARPRREPWCSGSERPAGPCEGAAGRHRAGGATGSR